MEGNTLMKFAKIDQAILEYIRTGISVTDIRISLCELVDDLAKAETYEPDNRIAALAQAIKDADFRP